MSEQKHQGAVSFIKNLLGFSASSYVGLVITLLATVVNTRLFVPSDLGKINLFITVGTVLTYVGYLGVDQSFCRYYNEKKGPEWPNRLLNVCFSLSLYAFFVIAAISLIGWRSISEYIGGVESFAVIVFLVIYVFSQIVCRYVSLIQRMSYRVLSYSVLLICMSFANKLAYSLVGIWRPDFGAAIASMAIAYIIIAAVFLGMIMSRYKYRIRLVEPLSRDSKMVLRFGLPLMPTSLLSWANASIPIFVIQGIIGYSSVGIYSSAMSIAGAMALVQSGFNTFWVPFVYKNYEDKSEIIKKVQNILVYVLVTAGLVLIMCQDLLYLLVGESYQAGKVFMPFLLLAPICSTIAEATGIGINISEKSYLNIIHYFCGIVSSLLLACILVPFLGLVGAALSVAISSVVVLVVRSFLGNKYYVSIESRYRTSISIVLLFAGATLNCVFVDSVLRYFCPLILIFALSFVFRKDLPYLFDVAKSAIRQFGKDER